LWPVIRTLLLRCNLSFIVLRFDYLGQRVDGAWNLLENVTNLRSREYRIILFSSKIVQYPTQQPCLIFSLSISPFPSGGVVGWEAVDARFRMLTGLTPVGHFGSFGRSENFAFYCHYWALKLSHKYTLNTLPGPTRKKGKNGKNCYNQSRLEAFYHTELFTDLGKLNSFMVVPF